MSTGPWITKEDKKKILDTLEPKLKQGIRLYKACRITDVPKSTVHKLMSEDPLFMNQIDKFMGYQTDLVSNLFTRRLMTIVEKVQGIKSDKIGVGIFKDEIWWKVLPQLMSEEDEEFLKWYATHSHGTREEFSDRQEVDVSDPQQRIKDINKLLDEKFGTNE